LNPVEVEVIHLFSQLCRALEIAVDRPGHGSRGRGQPARGIAKTGGGEAGRFSEVISSRPRPSGAPPSSLPPSSRDGARRSKLFRHQNVSIFPLKRVDMKFQG
jgi:hypothetical protein